MADAKLGNGPEGYADTDSDEVTLGKKGTRAAHRRRPRGGAEPLPLVATVAPHVIGRQPAKKQSASPDARRNMVSLGTLGRRENE
jgi:hypothetical protein